MGIVGSDGLGRKWRYLDLFQQSIPNPAVAGQVQIAIQWTAKDGLAPIRLTAMLVDWREVDSPEITGPMRKLKSDLPFTLARGAHVYDSKFALLSGIPVLHQDGLPFFDWRGQRDQSAVSIHGKHLRELAKAFPEHILPIGAYAHS